MATWFRAASMTCGMLAHLAEHGGAGPAHVVAMPAGGFAGFLNGLGLAIPVAEGGRLRRADRGQLGVMIGSSDKAERKGMVPTRRVELRTY